MRLSGGILDGLGFVEHDVVKVDLHEGLNVGLHDAVGGEEDVATCDGFLQGLPLSITFVFAALDLFDGFFRDLAERDEGSLPHGDQCRRDDDEYLGD